MPLSVLLALVVAAATGGDKSGAATRARQQLEAFGSHRGLVALSRRLERIMTGTAIPASPPTSVLSTGHSDRRADTHPCGRQSAPRVPGTAACRELLPARPHATPHEAGSS